MTTGDKMRPDADAQERASRVLLQRIAQQDQAALAELYDQTVGRVYGVALRIVRRTDLAEDVASEVFLQIWRNAGRYDPSRGDVLAWILVITRSRALDQLRRLDEADLHPDPQQLVEHDTHATPVELLTAIQSNHELHAKLQKLTPEQRQLIGLAFFKGFSHQEIADHTRLPLGTVKTHLRRALGVLRHSMTEESRHWS